MMDGVEVTNSGLKFEGDWDGVCKFSKELEEVMEEYIESKKELDDFEDWRPHNGDSDSDMRDKTAEEAAVGEQNIEKGFEGASKELNEVEEKMIDSLEDIKNGIDPSKDLKEALTELERVLGVESIRSIRKVEKTIYKKLMLKINPYYFDTEDFSVNLDVEKDDLYCLKINVSEDDLREKFQGKFE